MDPEAAHPALARCLGALATARLFAGDAAAAHDLHAGAVAIYRDLGESMRD